MRPMISSTMHFLNGTLDDDGDENIVPTSILCAGCVCVLYATIDEMKKNAESCTQLRPTYDERELMKKNNFR